MPRWLSWVLRIFVGLLIVAAAAYWWLFMESGKPPGVYRIDIAAVRVEADAISGPKPTGVRVEEVATLTFPAVAIVAGDGWATVPMQVYAYQLIYPDGFGIIDTAMGERANKSMKAQTYDAAAQKRVEAAMKDAAFVVVTHEHMDHIGGLIEHPEIKAVMPRTKLNPEQARDNADIDLAFPAGALDGYQPLAYEGIKAIAPGVVLIRAPGHTPGSQIVYVRTEAGQEYLFIGDVAWKRRNIDEVRERARLVTMIMGEDRDAVLDQLAMLNALAVAVPDLIIVPGHEATVIDALVASGAMARGFQ